MQPSVEDKSRASGELLIGFLVSDGQAGPFSMEVGEIFLFTNPENTGIEKPAESTIWL